MRGSTLPSTHLLSIVKIPCVAEEIDKKNEVAGFDIPPLYYTFLILSLGFLRQSVIDGALRQKHVL